jgi:hypothetical protein
MVVRIRFFVGRFWTAVKIPGSPVIFILAFWEGVKLDICRCDNKKPMILPQNTTAVNLQTAVLTIITKFW